MPLSASTLRELGWRFPLATVNELVEELNSVELTNTAVATVGAATLTAASIVGGVITRSGSTAAFTDTTDTAAAIIAALVNPVVGQSWLFQITNTTAFAETLSAGSGVTLSGLSAVIPPNATAQFVCTYTAAGAVTMLCTDIGTNNGLGGVAAGYRIARGVAAVTGTATVVTGLNTVVAVIAVPQSDLDGTTLAGVSATIGDQAGTPAAGSVILKCWKATSSSVTTLIAATSAENVNWIAIGT